MSYSKVDLLILSISVIWVKSLTFSRYQLLKGEFDQLELLRKSSD